MAKSCESLLSVSQCDPFKWHEVQLSICLNYWSAVCDGMEKCTPKLRAHCTPTSLWVSSHERHTSGPFTILCVGNLKNINHLLLSWLSFSVSDVLTFFSFRICYHNLDFMSAGPNAERPTSWHNKIVFYRWDKVLVFLFIWTKWFLVLCIHKVSWRYHTALKAVNGQQWCCLCSPAFLCIVVLLVGRLISMSNSQCDI